MKRFLAVYIGTASAIAESGWVTMDEGKRKELEASGMKAWEEWVARNRECIVDYGGRLAEPNGYPQTASPIAPTIWRPM